MNDLTKALAGLARPHGDVSPFTRRAVVSVDADARRLEVAAGDATMTIPALGFIDDYEVGDVVLVAYDGVGPIALAPIGKSRAGASQPPTGTVVSVGASTVTVSIEGGTVAAGSVVSAVIGSGDQVLLQWDENGKPWIVGEVGVVDATPATPTGLTLERNGNTVLAAADASSGATSYRWRYNYGGNWQYESTTTPATTLGIGDGQTLTVSVSALSTGGQSAYSTPKSVTRPAEVKYETFTVTIQPSNSGTYRHSVGRWNDWNHGRWDFPRTLYQGNAYGSGDMTGLAVFGNRIADLAAVEITEVTLKIRRNDYAGPGAERAEVRGATNGAIPSGAPSLTGESQLTPSMGKGATRTLNLSPEMCEALRTGDIKGLALVGSGDAGFYGTGGSMSLEITGTKRS